MSKGPDGGIAKRVFELVPGVWWPAADEHACRAAARAWADVASCTHAVSAAGTAAAASVITGNAGAEFDEFAAHWQRFDTGALGGFLPEVAVAAEGMSRALNQYADSVTRVKRQVEEELLIAAGTILVGAGTLWIPVVGEVGAATAAATSAALVAATAALESAFITAVAEIAGSMLAGAAFGALTAVVADVVVAQPVKMAFGDQAAWHWDAGEMLTAAKGGAIGGSIAGGLSGATQLAGVMSEGGVLAAGAPRLAAALSRMPSALESPIGQVLAGSGVNAAAGYALNGKVTGLDLVTGAVGAMAGHVTAGRAGQGPLLDEVAQVDPTSALADAAGNGFRSRLGALNEVDAVIRNQGRLPDLPEGWSADAVLSPVGRSPIGGDFAVSSLSNEGRTLEVALLDAKGHGAEAAPTSIALAGPLQTMIAESPGEPFLDAASAHVADHLGFGEPVPGVHLSLDLQTGDYVLRDAGNGAPFHVHNDGTWEPLQGRGVMLGTREMVPPDLRGTPHTGTVAPGETLVLYTDGVVEMPGNRIPAGMELLRSEGAPLIEAGHPLVAQRILDALPGYGDDRSLILIRRAPPSDVFTGPGQPFDPAVHGAGALEVVGGLDPGLRSTYDELWRRTVATGDEHALVRLDSGDVVIARGGLSVLIEGGAPRAFFAADHAPADGAGSGTMLRTVADIVANPRLLSGRTPGDLQQIVAASPEWRGATPAPGDPGWVLRQFDPAGEPTGLQVRWNAGGPHPGLDPYWEVVGPHGLSPIIRSAPGSERGMPAGPGPH